MIVKLFDETFSTIPCRSQFLFFFPDLLAEHVSQAHRRAAGDTHLVEMWDFFGHSGMKCRSRNIWTICFSTNRFVFQQILFSFTKQITPRVFFPFCVGLKWFLYHQKGHLHQRLIQFDGLVIQIRGEPGSWFQLWWFVTGDLNNLLVVKLASPVKG